MFIIIPGKKKEKVEIEKNQKSNLTIKLGNSIMNVVQNGGADLNMAVTSREEILAVCRRLWQKKGFRP